MASIIGAVAVTRPTALSVVVRPSDAPLVLPRMVFLIAPGRGAGGGGGGNRQPAPIRRAERVGHDRATVPIARPLSTTGRTADVPTPAQQLLLDAKPLAFGLIEQIGALEGGMTFGTSQGPGSGNGVGEGVGTGVGSGRGPGAGPGSGGGTGGGLYRPGGAVTPPTLVAQVRPSYTSDALRRKIQGTVLLEAIVRANGRPSNIRVVRSLDPGGLDEQAIEAVQQWRFNPGRLADVPVDVLVTIVLDFSIR
jgi:TonB family protein